MSVLVDDFHSTSLSVDALQTVNLLWLTSMSLHVVLSELDTFSWKDAFHSKFLVVIY